MKSGTYEGVWPCMHNIWSVSITVFLQFSRRNFLVCSFESQDGGKKGIAEKWGRRPNHLSNSSTERKKHSQHCLEGGHRDNCVNIIVIDQKYLQNGTVVAKLIQNLFRQKIMQSK
jgi:hypothetical protein